MATHNLIHMEMLKIYDSMVEKKNAANELLRAKYILDKDAR